MSSLSELFTASALRDKTNTLRRSNIFLIALLTVGISLLSACNSSSSSGGTVIPPPGDSTAPVISLLGTSPVNVTVGTSYADAGATATDDVDGDITSSIVTVNPVNSAVIGTYTVTYNVSDTAGNAAAQVTRTINVVALADTTAPVITLLGTSPVSVTVGSSYSDAGATAADDVDGDITSSIVVGGDTVDAAVVGAYVITFDVSDAAGNAATQVTRTVNVVTATSGLVSAYYSAAPNWNDYVKNDLTTQFDATNTPADGTETGGYSAVIHGGEMRSVDIGITTCTDQTGTDALGAFDWVCDDSTGSALMVSTGLKKDKDLSDLLDFTTPGWLSNAVTVSGTGAGLPFTTASSAWWSNPVVVDNNGGNLSTSGSVYVVTANPSAAYTITANKIALVIKPGVFINGPGSAVNLISADTQNYLWVEGRIAGVAKKAFRALSWSTVKFSVLRNLSVSDIGGNGVHLDASSDNNSLFKIISSNNFSYGVGINASSNNTLSTIVTVNNNHGINFVSSANNNKLSMISTYNNTRNGINFDYSSNNNSLSYVNAANNGIAGILMKRSSNNTLTDIVAINNRSGGIYLQNSSSTNTLLNITTANSSGAGVGLFYGSINNIMSNVTVINSQFGLILNSGSTNNTLLNMAAANNLASGISLLGSSNNNTLSNTAAANIGGSGVSLDTSSNNTFTGVLKVGNNTTSDCSVTAGTLPGLVDTTCANNGSSNAALTTGITMAASFVGKVITDDTKNVSDTNGTATYPAFPDTFDWTNFENHYRGWGRDGSAFPDTRQQLQWTSTAGTGRIWDLSLANGDTGDSGNPVIQNVLAVQLIGNAANTLEHTWVGVAADQTACTALVPGSVWNAVDDCRSTFLRNASEIADDSIGNNNGLCESGETCLYTPNMGSYQGHGTLQSAGVFTDGDTLTGITLMQYPTNGY